MDPRIHARAADTHPHLLQAPTLLQPRNLTLPVPAVIRRALANSPDTSLFRVRYTEYIRVRPNPAIPDICAFGEFPRERDLRLASQRSALAAFSPVLPPPPPVEAAGPTTAADLNAAQILFSLNSTPVTEPSPTPHIQREIYEPAAWTT